MYLVIEMKYWHILGLKYLGSDIECCLESAHTYYNEESVCVVVCLGDWATDAFNRRY